MDNDYTQITWPEVRKGDVLLHENGDRLTVERGGEVIVEAVGHELATDAWAHMGFTPYRKQPERPNEPGAHADKDGNVWLLGTFNGQPTWFDGEGGGYEPEDIDEFGPFTRLVPMPTRERVFEALSEVRFNLTTEQWNTWQFQEETKETATAAVMALLTGGKQEAES